MDPFHTWEIRKGTNLLHECWVHVKQEDLESEPQLLFKDYDEWILGQIPTNAMFSYLLYTINHATRTSTSTVVVLYVHCYCVQGWQVGSVVRALDWRSKDWGFESHQEHKKNFKFFRVKMVVLTRCWCAQPSCVYAHIRKTMYAC